MQVLVNGHVINYTRKGNGPTVILVHGWADSLATFNDLFSGLSTYYDVIAIDLPGFGSSTIDPREVIGLEDFAKIIASFEDKLNLKVYAYVGHSNGGAILIKGLAKKMLSADKLILLASSGIRPGITMKKTALLLTSKVGKSVMVLMPKRLKESTRKKFYKTIGSDYLITPGLAETFKKIISQDVLTDSADINIPTLLIYGTNDKATPREFGEKFHDKIKNSRLEIISGAGHFIHHDQPEKVNDLIKEFLK